MAKATTKKSGRAKLSKSDAVVTPRSSKITPGNKLNYKARSVIVGDSSRVTEIPATVKLETVGEKNHSTLGARIVISLIAILVIIIAGIYVSMSFAGQAIKIETPQANATDLDTTDMVELLIDPMNNTPFLFNVTLSNSSSSTFLEGTPTLLNLSFVTNNNDIVEYTLTKANAHHDLVGHGYLGSTVLSLDGVYVNDDNMSDLALVLNGPYFDIVNLNYLTPDAARIIRINPDTNVTISDMVIPATKSTSAVALFNISSTKLPVVTFNWQNGSRFSVAEARLISNTSNSSLWQVNWTPTIDKGSVPFLITAQVDELHSEKRFVFAVGGVEYALLNNDGSARVELYKINGVMNAHYILGAGAGLQPLMAPCAGFPSLDSRDITSKIDTVYTYNERVQQWKQGAPSEFDSLDVTKGYMVKLKQGQTLDVRYPCTAGVSPPSTINLQSGWNLVSLGGTVSQDVSHSFVPPVGTQVRFVFEVLPGNIVPVDQISKVDPGRVYWVKVQ